MQSPLLCPDGGKSSLREPNVIQEVSSEDMATVWRFLAMLSVASEKAPTPAERELGDLPLPEAI